MTSLPSYQVDLITKTRKLLEGARNVPLSTVQRATLTDPEVKGPSWVSRTSFPAPKDGTNGPLSLLERAIEVLGDGKGHYTRPSVEHVDARWTGYRLGAGEDEAEPSISERQKYQGLMKDVKNPLTILYLHGGGFTMGTPGRYHKVISRFAHSTGGRCLTFRYRLAPQHPFPAALLDALVCYLSLLYPPLDAFHEPLPPSSIVFAGDSAGANLALALTQILLFARSSTVLFHGAEVSLPLPGGIAVLSAGLDVTLGFPSWQINAPHDIFSDTWSFLAPGYPTCAIWPSGPPRGHVYCEISTMLHPLVAPAFARNWEGAPPMWFAGGQERFADSAKLAAERAARQGVQVWYEEYEEMPHDFAIMSATWAWAKTEEWPQSVRCMEEWVNACRVFGEGGRVGTGAVVVLTGGRKREMDVQNLTGLAEEEVTSLAREKQEGWKVFTGYEKARSSL